MPYAPTEHLLVEHDGPIVTITLNNPDMMNAFLDDMLEGMREIWWQLSEDDSVRAVVITGAGRAFSAGGDIPGFIKSYEDSDYRRKSLRGAKRLMEAQAEFLKPVVAAVNGAAVGLGCNVALCSDIVFMAESAFLADTHVSIGLVCGDGGAVFWPLLMGLLKCKEYLLTGDRIPCGQGARAGPGQPGRPRCRADGSGQGVRREAGRAAATGDPGDQACPQPAPTADDPAGRAVSVVSRVRVVRDGRHQAHHRRLQEEGEVSVYGEILYEVDDPVAVITLNRPAALNAWTSSMDAEIADAMRRAAADPAVVGIVVTGAGRAFCAGADMKSLSSLSQGGTGGELVSGEAPWRSPEGDFGGRFPYVMTIDKPVIAAINGAVAGMAFPFALCCDLRVVTPDALFLTAFAQRGLIAEWGLSWLLPRLVGPAVALDLLFSSRRVKGDEAFALGLANYLVPGDELLGFCRAYIENLARSCSPTSMAIMKRQVYEHLHRGLGEAELDSQRLMAESFGRPDFKEGVQSFLDKRSPSFKRVGD